MKVTDFISLKDVAKRYGVHLSSPHRWRLRGVSGVRLRTIRIGGKRFTTEEWLDEFHAAVTAAVDGDSPPRPESDEARQRRLERVDAELEAAGF